MAAPVWVLSVDLQTKTATFQTGLSDAAKKARAAFTEIQSGSNSMGVAVGGNMRSARQSVMLLGEEFGVHLPRGLTTFISSLGPVGAAMEAAFPFVAIAVGATLLFEHLHKMHEAGEKLTEDQVRFGTAVQNAFNSLDEKLLSAQIHADELRNDHIGALALQLQLINRQSMDELVRSFGEVAKAADVVFAGLKHSWYQFGNGFAGAQASLERFGVTYAALIAKHDDKGASDLLRSTVERESQILALQRQAESGLFRIGPGAAPNQSGNTQYLDAMNRLKQYGVGISKDEIAAQQKLVDTLKDQLDIEAEVGKLKGQDAANTKRSTAAAMSSEAAQAGKQAADAQLRLGESAVAADRAMANARLDVQRASIAVRLASEVAFADESYRVQLAANGAQIMALDQLSKDYPNQLKALYEKAAEITQAHQTQVAELTAKATTDQAAKSLRDLESSERDAIEATQQGSVARLAAIGAALKKEEALNLQDTNFYRELEQQKIQTIRQAADEEAKLREEAGKEAADNEDKMGSLMLAATKQHQALLDSAHRVSIQARMQEEIEAANAEYALKLTALSHEIAALDKSGKDYENKLRALNDKQKQLIQQHENEVTAIKETAEIERNQRILAAESQFNNTVAQGLTQVLMGHKSFAAEMDAIGSQVAQGMMENAIKSVLANDFTKESDAAAAARKMFLAGAHFPFPVNIVMAPLLGALAFASVMAFQDGTDGVPGSGRGDKVPAMLEPGEGVVPGGVMDGLRSMARSGSLGGRHVTHIHVRPTYNLQAMDSSGLEHVLTKHSDTLERHVQRSVRRLNR